MKNNENKAWAWFIVFSMLLMWVWIRPVSSIMTIHDWVIIILLELPLQLGVHYLTHKDVDSTT